MITRIAFLFTGESNMNLTDHTVMRLWLQTWQHAEQAFCFNESGTQKYIDYGHYHKSNWKTKGGGAGTDEGWGEKRNHFGVEAEKKNGDHFGARDGISFPKLYNHIYLQYSYHNKRAKGYQV